MSGDKPIDAWDWDMVGAFIFMGIAVAVAVLSMRGCPNPDQARDILEAEGYTDVVPDRGGFSLGCGKGDNSRTAFEATAPGGSRVQGVVCCGLVVKDCTVRLGKVLRRAPQGAR